MRKQADGIVAQCVWVGRWVGGVGAKSVADERANNTGWITSPSGRAVVWVTVAHRLDDWTGHWSPAALCAVAWCEVAKFIARTRYRNRKSKSEKAEDDEDDEEDVEYELLWHMCVQLNPNVRTGGGGK